MNINDVLAALAVVLNGIPQGLLAISYGFAALPTAFAFLIGALGAIVFKQVAPISFQAETIVLAGTLGRDRKERLSLVFWGAIGMSILGLAGLLEATVGFAGTAIINGMMAGVGIMLAMVAINMVKSHLFVGGIAVVSALLIYVPTNDLVYTIMGSVVVSSVAWIIYCKMRGKQIIDTDENAETGLEKLIMLKPKISRRILRGALAYMTLQIGGNITYASITAGMSGAPVNVDIVTVYSGIASAVSAFFGGGPVEAIISGTGAAPNPGPAAWLMMGIFAIILAVKLLPIIGRYIRMEAIAGFLFVLGALVVVPIDARIAIEADPVLAGVTLVVTAATFDPFIGLVSGLVLRGLIGIF